VDDRLAITRMIMSRRAMVLGAAAAAGSAVLAACGSSKSGTAAGSSTQASPSAAGGAITKGGTLTIARAADSQSMNKTTVFDNESIWVFEQIYQPLYKVSPDGTKTLPCLATGYTVSKDQLTYTFTIRSGVTFHNGSKLTAADVKFSIDQASAASQGWGYINDAIKTTAAPSDDTFVITLKYPWAPLIADLSLFSNGIIPDKYAGKTEAAFYNAPIGTGPFVWDVWDKGSKLTLKKNPKYWEAGKPYLDSVVWTDTPDSNTRSIQLKGGQTDIDEFPAWSTVSQLKSTPGVAVDLFSSTRTDYLIFNEKRKPFQDVHVRRAISMAIDRKALIKAVLFGNGTVANSFIAPTVPYYDKNAGGLQLDLAAAKKEMALSTVPKGFSTTLTIASGEADDLLLAQIVQSALKQLDIIVKIVQLDANTANTDVQGLDYDMSFEYWTMDISDPDELVTFAVNPTSGAHSFFTSYSNPTVTKTSVTAAKTLDPAGRTKLYAEIQADAAADAFMAYLYYSPYAYARSTKVNGFFVTPLGNYHIEDVWKSA
jgi:peptide/nickel transport system substrate-binding protein